MTAVRPAVWAPIPKRVELVTGGHRHPMRRGGDAWWHADVELPPGVDLSAYRVIQEALTNALKYAGPARAWVTVRWLEHELVLEIANDGRSEAGGDGGGHGLAGLRERVALVRAAMRDGLTETDRAALAGIDEELAKAMDDLDGLL